MLGVILTLLLCSLGFFIYLADKNKSEILLLKNELREKENEISSLRDELRKKNAEVVELTLKKPQTKRFVSVIFRKGDRKCYDYFVGKNQDVQVGDFVEVYIRDKEHGKPKRTIAEVVYLSEPGEESKHAKSAIKCKADRPKW